MEIRLPKLGWIRMCEALRFFRKGDSSLITSQKGIVDCRYYSYLHLKLVQTVVKRRTNSSYLIYQCEVGIDRYVAINLKKLLYQSILC